jgi:hypothetical protein
VSPIHGAQDVSLTPFTHTPFTHFLLLPDTARRSACTRFLQTCPISELVLMFCFMMRQFVNADASHGSLHRSHLRLLRSQQRDVVDGGDGQDRLSVNTSSSSVMARAVPTVQTTSLSGNWQYSQCLAYVFLAFLCTCNR